jgi:hypothetical protein
MSKISHFFNDVINGIEVWSGCQSNMPFDPNLPAKRQFDKSIKVTGASIHAIYIDNRLPYPVTVEAASRVDEQSRVRFIADADSTLTWKGRKEKVKRFVQIGWKKVAISPDIALMFTQHFIDSHLDIFTPVKDNPEWMFRIHDVKFSVSL